MVRVLRNEDSSAEVTVASPELSLVYPGAATVSYTWKMLGPLEGRQGDLRVFVHLLSEDGELLRTFDHGLPFENRLLRSGIIA